MPPKAPPKCIECQKTESLLWRQVAEQGGQICQECYEQKELKEKANQEGNEAVKNAAEEKGKDHKDATKETPEGKATTAAEEKRLRKSTRATRFKAKASSASGGATTPANGNSSNVSSAKVQSKGRNRRNLFKKVPFKTPVAQATTHVVDSVFYKGSYLQVGDIVSLADNDHNVYYAQVRGLLVDSYCEKSAFLTWLIPTQASPDPQEGFDAATYLIGPDEELSRKLSCLEFVMHAPSNYYLDRTTPFPLPDTMEYDSKPGGYIWTTLQEYQRKKTAA